MNTVTRNSRLLIIVVSLTVLSMGQVIYAQDSTHERKGEIPQWVIDRQQYETTYIYVPAADDVLLDPIVPRVPQWVRDRQQYETTYIYVSPAADLRPADNR
jgi:hypothetical protein